MKAQILFAVGAVALACLLLASPALAKSYDAEQYNVVLDVQPGGSLLVTETIRFRFEGGPFTYVFRDLAYTELDEIDRLQASMDGALLPQGTGPGQVEVVVGRPIKVTWHFAPTSDAVHEFVLTYRVQGAIRQEAAADALIWRAIPEDHDYDIARSTITLRYPASISLEEVLWRGTYVRTFPGNPRLACIYPALGFAVSHLSPELVFPAQGGILPFVASTFFLGLAFGWVAYKTSTARWTAITLSLIGLLAFGLPLSSSLARLAFG
jgi:hypothetical protein